MIKPSSLIYSLTKVSQLLILFFLISPQAIFAQESKVAALLDSAANLRKNYLFDRAIQSYESIIENTADSSIILEANREIIRCKNGKNLTQFVSRPKVIGKAAVSASLSYLYIDLSSKAFWTLPPKALLQAAGSISNSPYPILYRPHSEELFFSAADSKTGNYDIFSTRRLNDTLWSAPIPLEDGINSPGNEIYPILSPDGQKLFFSSDGLGGMGGYNLFVCRRAPDGTWEAAENMGVPYSSPENDFFMLPSEDMKYLYFASARHPAPDSLYLCKVVYESTPIRYPASSLDEIRSLAALDVYSQSANIQGDTSAISLAIPVGTPEYLSRQYHSRLESIRIKESVMESLENKLKDLRTLYKQLSDTSDLFSIRRHINRREAELLTVQEEIEADKAAMQQTAQDFINLGLPLPVIQSRKKPVEQTIPLQAESFNPTMGILEEFPKATFLSPQPEEPAINLKFRRETVSELVEMESLPMELFYRVQLFTATKKAGVKQLRGFCPAFELRTRSSFYYQVGMFPTYQSAVNAQKEVKAAGFSSAIVIAYNQGKRISLGSARNLEKQGPAVIYRVYLGNYPDGLPADVRTAAGTLSAKDIARSTVGSEVRYYIGPFTSLSEAEALVNGMHEKGFTDVKIE